MKYFFLLFIILLNYNLGYTCGGEYFGPHFYDIIDETLFEVDAYRPFYHDLDNRYYEDVNEHSSIEGNLRQWKESVQGLEYLELRELVLTKDERIRKRLLASSICAFKTEVLDYLRIAHECLNTLGGDSFNYWSYIEYKKSNAKEFSKVLKKVLAKHNACHQKEIKQRYAYQVVRLYHYLSDHRGAVDFYNSHIMNNYEPNEISFYIDDQIAGCYYSLGNFDKASYLFMKVFRKSRDRKVSAYQSFEFCTYKDGDPSSYFVSPIDNDTYLVLNNLNTFSSELDILDKLSKNKENKQLVYLLLARSLKKLESWSCITTSGIDTDPNAPFPSPDDETLKHLQNFKKQVISHKELITEVTYMKILSYIEFMKSDTKKALKILSSPELPKSKEIERLMLIYESTQWKTITNEIENSIARHIDIPKYRRYTFDSSHPSSRTILDRIGHLYLQQGELAKSFLIHNHIENLMEISSIELLDDIYSFITKENKSDFEKKLMVNTKNIQHGYNPIDYVNYLKGIYHLHKNEYLDALNYFNNSELDLHDNRGIEAHVDARIFSNGFKVCYSCDKRIALTDSVFLASVFELDDLKISKSKLVSTLMKLDTMTSSDKTWHRKLSNYLLGNYFYNTSTTGYYRGTLQGTSNGANAYHFKEREAARDIIIKKSGYNLEYIDNYDFIFKGHVEKAKAHFTKTIELSQDKELNARCTFMLARCDLNKMYTLDKYSPSFYNGSVNETTRHHLLNLKNLQNNYSDTDFYKLVIKECSFFRYYSSQ